MVYAQVAGNPFTVMQASMAFDVTITKFDLQGLLANRQAYIDHPWFL